jgi:hypothetical protein|nr:MAG TPA: hypothetical protein [Caudoviricetes sp.]
MKRRVFGSYTGIFEEYDKKRRERDFLRLKEMCEFKFGIDNVWTDSFQIPIFDKNGEKLFAIQMLLNTNNFRVAIYFNNSKMLSEFDRKYGAYTKYVLTINELYEQMDNLIYSMYKFLGKKELYFSDYPDD